MIKLYRDDAAKSIFIEDDNGAQFPNSLQAIKNADDSVSIIDLARSIEIVSNEPFSEFVDDSANQYGLTAQGTVDALNTEFSANGTITNDLPSITSNLGVSLTEGETLNYELTADYGVGYEWDLSNVPGVTTVDGNVRKIIGGSGLAAGEYAVPVKAINYNGEDSQVLEVSVGSPPFANTKSVQFNNNDFLSSNAGILQNVLGRSANGSGSSDAWSVALWFKAGTASNASQTIIYYGGQDVANGGHFQIKYNGQSNAKRLEMRYGTSNNRLNFVTQNNSIVVGQWHHVFVSYDGGTTGSSSGSMSSYYGRFRFFIDGVDITSSNTNSNNNFGYTGSVLGQNFNIGKYNNGQTLRNNCKIDELAVWDSDQSSNASLIYNNGNPHDLINLSQAPAHWWRMGDGDSFPYLFDVGTEANTIFIMNNMTAADIVSDTP